MECLRLCGLYRAEAGIFDVVSSMPKGSVPWEKLCFELYLMLILEGVSSFALREHL